MATEHAHGLEAVLARVRDARNFDFRSYKRATLRRRVERRMQERRTKTYDAYLELLDRDADEVGSLLSSMLIKVTSFFRDPETWSVMRKVVVPDVLSRKRPGDEIRVWSAGCATGEEAYSIAMLFLEAIGSKPYDLKVFGTDLDEHAVAFARRSIYSPDQIASVPKEMLARWFVETPEGYAVRKEARRGVVFGVNNLVSDAPISRLDLLICRNVFIYFDAELQRQVLSRFHYALRRDGILVLGRSELIPYAGKIFSQVDMPRRVYRKDARREETKRGTSRRNARNGPNGKDGSLSAASAREAEAAPFAQLLHELLDSLPTPVIATSLDGTVVHWNSASARLWSRNEGQVLGKKLSSLNLAGLRGELLVEKTRAVAAGKSEREHADGSLSRPGEAEPITIDVEVIPLRNASSDRVGLVYLVRDVTHVREIEAALRKANDEREAAYEEVQTTNEELQSSNEELETTNEELQSANEELQTTNEELQSTNEELETTNEELQSTNAELDATNRELGHRTDELNVLSFYHRTILRSLTAAVIVIDPTGKVTLWNLAAERILGLAETEALGQRLWSLRVPALHSSLLKQLERTIAKKKPLRIEELAYELPTGGEGTAQLAAVPLTDGKATLGAVILFEDTTRLRALQEEVTRLRPAPAKRSRRT